MGIETTIPMKHESDDCGHEWGYTPENYPPVPSYCTCPGCQSKISVSKHRQDGDDDE